MIATTEFETSAALDCTNLEQFCQYPMHSVPASLYLFAFQAYSLLGKEKLMLDLSLLDRSPQDLWVNIQYIFIRALILYSVGPWNLMNYMLKASL